MGSREKVRKTELRHRYGAGATGLSLILLVAGCGPEQERKPAAFEPTRVQVNADDHIARCNTVHSLTLPQAVLRSYGFEADADRAILSCSLQVTDDVPVNIPARISGTATALTGATSQLEFKEILEEGAVSYVAAVDLAAKSAIRFDVSMTDLQTGARYNIELRQVELPGRR